MPNVRDFVIDLARAGESANSIKLKVNDVYKEDGLSLVHIYRLMKLVKDDGEHASRRGRHTKHKKRTKEAIEAVSEDLGLCKKDEMWAPRLRSLKQKSGTKRELQNRCNKKNAEISCGMKATKSRRAEKVGQSSEELLKLVGI